MWPNIDVRFLPKTQIVMLSSMHWDGPYPCVVPAGFKNDAGSIPSIAWFLVGHPFSYSMLAIYILHDYELSIGVPWLEAAKRLRIRTKARGHVGNIRRHLVGGVVTIYAFFKKA